MIYKILDDYKNTFSFRKNYLKYFTKLSIVLSISIVVLNSAISIICCIIYKTTWPVMFISGSFILIFPIIKREINRIIKEIYGCKNKLEIGKLFKQEFEIKLRKRNIDVHNIDQVDYLICLLEQNLIEMKPSLYIKSGILASVLGPLWICYLNTIFKYVINIDEATELFVMIILIFILFWGLFYVIKHEIMDYIIHSDYYQLKLLLNLVKDFRLINMTKKLLDIA